MGDRLIVRGARENNLCDVDVDLPRDNLIVFTGLSGSGKSSLAFDTIYAEGQRRYVESLSAYARQFLGQMDKPDVDFLEGLSPAISIDQKSASRNPRSTVGTITEVYDYLRLLYARIGVQHDPETGEVVQRQTSQEIVDRILTLGTEKRFQVLAPIVRGRKGEYHTLLTDLASQGYVRARVDGETVDLGDKEILPEERLDRYVNHDIEVIVDRLVLKEGIEQRLTESIETALNLADGHVWIEVVPSEGEGEIHTYSQHLFSPATGRSFEDLAPRNFSFNSPYGACATCDGLGTRFEVDPELIIPNTDLSIEEGAIAPFATGASRWYGRLLRATGEEFDIPIEKPWSKLTAKQRKLILYGSSQSRTFTVRYRNRYGRSRSYTTHWEGVIPTLQRRHADTDSDHSRDRIEGYMREVPCAVCDGARLNEVSLAVRVADRNIHELCSVSIGEAAKVIDGLSLSDRDMMIAAPIVKEIDARLNFLLDVGLDYLTLNRSAATLAGGEAQRIRLASQIGSGLEGVLYVLDEPSIGLHQRDNRRLIETLQNLRDLGNTVLVVEHDEETILEADWVVDIGPGAGEHGGEIIYSGPVKGLTAAKGSITGDYLRGARSIETPEKRREPISKVLTIKGAR
ncbi:MAG TPA: excinuclease ABC subunit A, partial [Acidimicrobiaceae bacterium]|nr:excinuclease ABC subunit A [Acidimicrobiaceae bacterium]